MKTINIFGTSEKSMEMGKKEILHLLSSNPSIGINDFGIQNPEVTYLLFSDGNVAERLINGQYKGQQIITNRHLYDTCFKGKPYFRVSAVYEPNNIQDSFGNSAFFALWWAVKEGFKKINLYGILDSDKGYVFLANGNCRYYNAYTGNYHCFQEHQYKRLLSLVENGFEGKVEICRPKKKH